MDGAFADADSLLGIAQVARRSLHDVMRQGSAELRLLETTVSAHFGAFEGIQRTMFASSY
ncbi:hypothetical protein [Sphingopyxis panaciterrulae]|uniref:Uncharacterized protein n=1 Tax=Sphingopyxis panaciterrulae TaxID=462372 RepID=A0A7W9ERF0_9SPHN|nr:hypothetical protein [Sphingopyxis panaciterrulae]MBB5707682.1 hypothetical protein [Sphingopyxis panaciterrulae]